MGVGEARDWSPEASEILPFQKRKGPSLQILNSAINFNSNLTHRGGVEMESNIANISSERLLKAEEQVGWGNERRWEINARQYA